MEKVNSFNEVIQNLKDHVTLTTKGKDTFYLKDGFVTCKFNGSTFRITLDEFLELYKDTIFYYLENEQESVDLKKDEEYYARIQKRN